MSLTDALEESPLRVVVVGDGLAACVAARELARPGFAVTVVPGSSRGEQEEEPVDDAAERIPVVPIEFGDREGVLRQLLTELGLAGRVERPEVGQRRLAFAGRGAAHRIVREPDRLLLGIPASPLAADVAAAIGWRGAWRAFLDRLRPVLSIGQERRLARLVRRHMGRRVLEQLVTPAAFARFGVAPQRLDVAHALPGLNPALTRAGTLSGAVTALLGVPPAPRAGLAGGLTTLVDALAVDVTRRGATLLASQVARVAKNAGEEISALNDPGEPLETVFAVQPTWHVELADDTVLDADVVILALEPAEALALVAEAGGPGTTGRHAELDSAELDSAVSDPFVLDQMEVTLLVRSGFQDAADSDTAVESVVVAPRGTREPEPALVEIVDESVRWPSLRAGLASGRRILRLRYVVEDASVKGLSAPSPVPMKERVLREASSALGVALAEDDLEDVHVHRWRSTAPRAIDGQMRRLKGAAAVFERAGLVVTGAWLAGEDPVDIAEHAAGAARRIRLARWRDVSP